MITLGFAGLTIAGCYFDVVQDQIDRLARFLVLGELRAEYRRRQEGGGWEQATPAETCRRPKE